MCAQERPASAPASPQVHQRLLPGSAWPSAGARTAPFGSIVRSFPRGLAGYQRRGSAQTRKVSDGGGAAGRAGVAVRRLNSAPETPSRLLVGRKPKPAVRLAGALGPLCERGSTGCWLLQPHRPRCASLTQPLHGLHTEGSALDFNSSMSVRLLCIEAARACA